MAKLLIRDLAQAVSPAGTQAPIRGREAMRSVEVVEDAFILCDDGRISAVGRMRDLDPLDGDVEELDGSGCAAIPGLVDCHTHAVFAGSRVEEFELRSGGATYEELHAAGGGILSTVRATRAAGEEGLADALALHRSWMLASGTTTFEAKSGYGLDRDTELAMLRVIREAGGSPTWLGAHAVPPEFADADAYLDFALAEVLPEAAKIAEAADVFLERGAFDAGQARRYLEACAEAGLRLRIHADQFTEAGGVPLADRAGRGERRPPRGDRPGEGVRALAQSDVAAVLLPVAALFLGRPMPPARRWSTRAPSSRSRPTSIPAAPSARACRSSCPSRARRCTWPGRGSRRLHRERRARPRPSRPGRAPRAGLRRRHRPARRLRLALPRLPPRGKPRRPGHPGGAPTA